jgi:hypothetical protein
MGRLNGKRIVGAIARRMRRRDNGVEGDTTGHAEGE